MKHVIRMEELTGLVDAIKGFPAKLSSFSLSLFFYLLCGIKASCLNQTLLLHSAAVSAWNAQAEILQADFQECRALMWFE